MKLRRLLSRLPASPFRQLAALSLLLVCSGCESVVPWNSVSTLPPEIPFNSSMTRVRWDRGSPQSTSVWYAARKLQPGSGEFCAEKQPHLSPSAKQAAGCVQPGQQLGTIWHYEEDWYRPHSFWADNWASWDLYFDSHNRYVGWRLVEPLGAETRARQKFMPGE